MAFARPLEEPNPHGSEAIQATVYFPRKPLRKCLGLNFETNKPAFWFHSNTVIKLEASREAYSLLGCRNERELGFFCSESKASLFL